MEKRNSAYLDGSATKRDAKRDAPWPTKTLNYVLGTAQYVLDSGALLHRIPWQRGSTLGAILDTYVDFVWQNYAQGIIIFDGYESFSTKDMTHKH